VPLEVGERAVDDPHSLAHMGFRLHRQPQRRTTND
jgi:hypothetical protein